MRTIRLKDVLSLEELILCMVGNALLLTSFLVFAQLNAVHPKFIYGIFVIVTFAFSWAFATVGFVALIIAKRKKQK